MSLDVVFLVLVFVLVFLVLLVFLFVEGLVGRLPRVVEHRPRDDPISEDLADLEVRVQEISRFLVHVFDALFGNDWGIEEVEEAVLFHFLGDEPGLSLLLVLLFLLDLLHRHVFTGFPIDCRPFAGDDFWTVEFEGHRLIGIALERVFLGEHGVGEMLVRREMEQQSERHRTV